MIEQEVVILNRHGLHLRAATALVEQVQKFDSEVVLSSEHDRADGRSILSLLMLGLTRGTRARLEVRGADEDAASMAITLLFREKFGEE